MVIHNIVIMHGSYNRDIERILSERDNFNIYDKPEINLNKKKDNYAKGMPWRPECTFSRQVYDGNSHLDFDIYDNPPVTTREIGYNDPENSDFCSTSRVSHTISENIDPTTVCINNINEITINLLTTICTTSDIMFNINGLGLYMGLLELYHGSTGNTEIELKSYCNFTGRIKTYACFKKFVAEHAKFLYPQISFRSYILYDSEMNISSQFKKKPLDRMVPIIPININNVGEIKRINKLIHEETKCINLISYNTLRKVELNIVSVIRINPIWGIKVNFLSTGKFMGDNSVFLNFKNCNIGYYKDISNNLQFLEIPMKGNNNVFGIIINKTSKNHINCYEDFASSISKIQLVNVAKLSIPKIVKRNKMRLNNLMKNKGIQACFLQTELPDIFPEDDNRISDILQYSDLILDEKSEKSENIKQSKRINNRMSKLQSIVINHEFTYYIRYIPNNLILCTGRVIL